MAIGTDKKRHDRGTIYQNDLALYEMSFEKCEEHLLQLRYSALSLWLCLKTCHRFILSWKRKEERPNASGDSLTLFDIVTRTHVLKHYPTCYTHPTTFVTPHFKRSCGIVINYSRNRLVCSLEQSFPPNGCSSALVSDRRS